MCGSSPQVMQAPAAAQAPAPAAAPVQQVDVGTARTAEDTTLGRQNGVTQTVTRTGSSAGLGGIGTDTSSSSRGTSGLSL